MLYQYNEGNYKKRNGQDIFVFGSNLAGIHGAGAAQEAVKYWGAIWCKGIGLYGQSYALPTKDKKIQTLKLCEIQAYVTNFMWVAHQNLHLNFLVTAIGCGLAGYTPRDIGPLFKNAPINCTFPLEFKDFLEK